jgi:hypothetical protein
VFEPKIIHERQFLRRKHDLQTFTAQIRHRCRPKVR